MILLFAVKGDIIDEEPIGSVGVSDLVLQLVIFSSSKAEDVWCSCST